MKWGIVAHQHDDRNLRRQSAPSGQGKMAENFEQKMTTGVATAKDVAPHHRSGNDPISDLELIRDDNSPIFRGCYDHSLDDKGRVSIPSSFRQTLEEKKIRGLVLTNYICDGARCIEAYSEPDWRELENRLAKRSRFDPQVKRLENYYLARAAHCPIDSSGRINIPVHLRSYAGLERDVVFASTIRGFRIWDKRVWELIFREAESALMEDPTIFENVDRE